MEKDREYKMMNDGVVPSTSRTIRRVPINKKQILEEKIPVVDEYIPPRRTPSRSVPAKTANNGIFTKIVLVAIFVISIVTIAAALSLAYAKGTLTIEPKQLSANINITFTANSKGEASLIYNTVTASDVSTEVVPAKPGKFSQSKAKGSVQITNNSLSAQSLVINTRLESDKGKIYRLLKAVSIPAGKKVSVTVVADEAGDSFNLLKAESGQLKIPGFKGSKKYDQFLAEVETDIVGGFSGTKNMIDPKVLSEARSRLISSVTELVKAKLKNQVDPNSQFYDSLIAISFVDLSQVAKSPTQSQISIKGNGLAYVFNTEELVKTLGAGELKKLGANNFKAIGLENVSILSKTPLKYSTTNPITLTAVGKITLIGDIPVESLKKELVGVSTDTLNDVLKKYEGIGKASAKISPFWKKSFPGSAERIQIEIQSQI